MLPSSETRRRPPKPSGGVWKATVTRISARGVHLIIPRYAGDQEFGPVQLIRGVVVAPREPVMVTFLEGHPDDPVILGALVFTMTPHTVGEAIHPS